MPLVGGEIVGVWSPLAVETVGIASPLPLSPVSAGLDTFGVP